LTVLISSVFYCASNVLQLFICRRLSLIIYAQLRVNSYYPYTGVVVTFVFVFAFM